MSEGGEPVPTSHPFLTAILIVGRPGPCALRNHPPEKQRGPGIAITRNHHRVHHLPPVPACRTRRGGTDERQAEGTDGGRTGEAQRTLNEIETVGRAASDEKDSS